MTKKLVAQPTTIQVKSTRKKWVDTAKALGVFLVFWGHILYNGSDNAIVVNRAIYSFHIPMFFILSGYVLKKETLSIKTFTHKKFTRILLPALIIYIITLPAYFYYLDYSTATIESVIREICYIDGKCAYNYPIWFFICLFEIYVIVKILNLANANIRKLTIILTASLFLSYICYDLKWWVFNIFGFNKCLLGLFFVISGMMLKHLQYENSMQVMGLIAVPLWIISGVWLNHQVSMYAVNYGIFGLFIISAFVGSFVFLAICKMIENSNLLRQYSKWTIFIICTHFVFVTCFVELTDKWLVGGTSLYDIISMLYVLMVLMAYKPVCVFFEKKSPILMGNINICRK